MFKINNNYYLILKTIIFVTILAYLYYFIDFENILNKSDFHLYINNYYYFFIFFFISIIINFLNTFRFSLIIKNIYNKKLSLIKSFQIIIYSGLASEIGNIFFFVSRYFLAKKVNLNLKKNIVVVSIEKIVSLLVYIIYFVIFIISIKFENIYLFFGLILFLILSSKLNIVSKYLKKIKNTFSIIFQSILIQILVVVQLYICAKFIGIDLTNYEIFFVIPFLIFLTSFSPTFTDWGYREFIFVLLLDYYKNLQEEAFILSISFGLMSLISSLIVVVIFEFYSFFLRKRF